jgi:hypothetical protein
MKSFLALLLGVLMLPALAEAGGGSKPNATIKVKNKGSDLLGVIVNPPSGLDPHTATEKQFTDAGGKFLNAGEEKSFSVKSGSNTVVAFYIDDEGFVGDIRTKTYSVGKGKTLKLEATGDFFSVGGPTLTVK